MFQQTIERANNVSWDHDIDFSFLKPEVAATYNALASSFVDVNLLRPTLELINPKKCALVNLKNGRDCGSISRRC